MNKLWVLYYQINSKHWNANKSRRNDRKYCKYNDRDAVSLIEVKQVWYHLQA